LRTGGGTRLKILEAMALGLPVVSTPKGAEGIDAADGQQILLGDRPSDLADRIASLVEDPGRSREIGEAGRELVLASYGPAALDRSVDAAIERMGLR
jgi:glycosyltransferase involved in cell wall biosynthesis